MNQQETIEVDYYDLQLENPLRLDLLVNDCIIVELKTVETFTDVHFAQILTYMKLGNYSTGLLINFNTKMLKQGIKRFRI